MKTYITGLTILWITLFLASCVNPNDATKLVPVNIEDWRDEVIYQVIIDRFANGDLNNDYNVDRSAPAAYHGGDYQGLIDNLDYLQNLGITALWISPVVKNVEEDAGVDGYHGYWTQNFVEVNRHFGDMAKLRELVNTCHDRGMKVILDIVTNHVGQLFYYDINQNGVPNEVLIGSGDQSSIDRTTEWDPDFESRGVQAFTSFGASGLAPITWVWSPEINRVPPQPAIFANPDWYNRKGRVFVWGNEAEVCGKLDDCVAGSWNNMCQEFQDSCQSYGIPAEERSDTTCQSNYPTCKEYMRFQEIKGDFPGGLKDINTELPEVQQAMVDVFSYWIENAGFDGFRIDTVKHVEHSFWEYFCREIRKRAIYSGKDNWFMFGEAFDGDDKLIASYTAKDQLDSVFYFSQKFQAFDSVFKYNGATRNIYNLWSNRLPDGFDMDSNTDGGARIKPDTFEKYYNLESQPNGPKAYTGRRLRPYEMLVNFIDNHDVPRFLYIGDGDQQMRCMPNDGICTGEKCMNADWESSNICQTENENFRCNCDIKGLHAALGLQFTMDGIPCVFYGTEQNFNGGNDPSNREDLWVSGYDQQNVTYQWVKKLAAIREQNAPLRRGRMVITWSSNNTAAQQDAGIFAFERQLINADADNLNPAEVKNSDIEDRVLVVINSSRSKISSTSESDTGGQDMLTTFSSGTRLYNVLSDNEAPIVVDNNQRVAVSVDPLSIKILVAR